MNDINAVNTSSEDSSNPLADALSGALGETEGKTVPTSDFIESTLAQIDTFGAQEEEGHSLTEDTTSDLGKSGDLLESIDEEFPDLDDKASPLARERWGDLKKELKQERAAMRAVRDELEGLKQKSLYDPAEVETLKQQLNDYDRELAVHRIEGTREYQTAIEQPLHAIGEAAASVARRYEIDQDLLFDALALEDEAKQQKALSDIVDGMSDRDRLKVYQMADDTLVLLKKRSDLKERSHEAMQELELRQRETQERGNAERQRNYTGHIDRLFEALEDKLPFHPLDPSESKAMVLENLKREALASDISGAGLDVQAYSAAAGVMLPRLINQFRALANENRALKSRLDNNSAASPTKARQVAPGSGGAPNTGSGGFLENIFAQIPS
jgi:hypothetical protein